MEGHNNLEITAKELKEKLNNGEKIIVEFHGLWCGPCKMMMPIFEKVAKNNQTEIQMYTMDIDKNKDYVTSIGIRSIPAIKSFNGSEVTNTSVGVVSEQSIKEMVTLLV
jgi:thioredoxin 1